MVSDRIGVISADQTAPETVGFEVCRTQPSSFLNSLYRAGFDEHLTGIFETDGEAKTKASLDKAGRLWELCLRHESSVPEVLSAAAVDAGILKDQSLIASVRATCCEVWLGAWEQGGRQGRQGRQGTTSAFLQIVEWVLQACDSLILCRQFSALWLILERVDLSKVLEAAVGITGADEMADAEADVMARLRPVVLATKMHLYRAYASMQCRTATADLSAMGHAVDAARQYLEQVQGDVAQVYCDSECMSVGVRFMGLLLDAEELEAAHELLKALSSVVSRLREKDEDLGRAWEARMVVGWIWCGRVRDIEMTKGCTLVDRLVALSLEGLRCLEDAEDLDPGLDARGEASRRLDALVRGNGADVAEALGKACASMVPRRRGMRMVLSTYAWTFQGPSRVDAGGGGTVAETGGNGAAGAIDGRRIFLLSVLGNLCLRFDATFAGSCPDACEVISSLLSNRIVVRSLQVDVGLARDLHTLLWNAACDADLAPTARVMLLSSAKAMADLTQDVACIRNALLSLARVRSKMWHFDVASELANRAEQYDALGAAIVKLEIEAVRSERSARVARSEPSMAAEAAGHVGAHVDVDAVKELVTGIFRDESAFGVHDGLDLVCRFMEAGDAPEPHSIISGIVLDQVLRLAISSSSSPDLALIMFQNLVALARSTKHPSLMESVYMWMQAEPSGLDIARVIVVIRGAKPQSTDVSAETIDGLRFVANHAASMAIDELRGGSPMRAQTAAMFAARILDALYDVEPKGRSKHAVASQVCWILACNAACLADGDINPGTLIAGLEDRRAKIRANSKTVDILSFHAQLSAIFIHIKTGADLRARDALQEIRAILPTTLLDTILLDILGRLPPSMPHTLQQALEIVLEVLTPENPVYFDAIRALATMPSASKDDTIRLVAQVHRLLGAATSKPSNAPITPFIEWFYVHAWNIGARTIALEGMERHNLQGRRQRALLKSISNPT